MGSYTVGVWNTSAKQDRGIFRIYNRFNRGLIESAIAAGTIINAGGSGYNLNDVLTLVDSGTTTKATQFTVTGVSAGAVTAVALVEDGPNTGGVYASHQNAANHSTTVSPAGGTGCVIRVNFYADIPEMCTRNGGILDNAVSSYARELDGEIRESIAAAIPTATTNQLNNVATTLGIIIPA